MNALAGFLEQPAVHRLGWTLVHFAWQGAAVALVAKVMLASLRQRSANARYATALVLLVLMACCPVVTFVVLGQSTRVAGSAESSEATVADMGTVGEPSVSGITDVVDPHAVSPDEPNDTSRVELLDERVDANATSTDALATASQPDATWAASFASVTRYLEPLLPWFVVVWSCGVTALSLHLLLGCWHVGRLRRQSQKPPADVERVFRRLVERMRLRRVLRLLESPLVHVPATIGWLRPVVLMPAGMLMGLPPTQLEAILAHELAHIRRYDYLANLVQSWIETLLFYHPAVWWLSRRVRIEREHACDDLAVSICGDRVVYAHALVEIAEMGRGRERLALAATGGDLHARIRRLLALPRTSSRTSPTWIAGAVLLALVCGLFVALAAAGDKADDAAAKADERSADESKPTAQTDDAPPKHADAKMVEIIKHVRENEQLYRNLETIVRRTTQIADASNPKKWSPTAIEERLHTVLQNDLIYFRGEETRTGIKGDKARNERLSAYDGEKTRSVEYGNSVNIHLGRHESPHVYPPHTWALVRLQINFPLSVFLEGTEAIREHPKVHRYPFERGSGYEFRQVETTLVGEEVVDGLTCVKIRCQRWFYSKDPPATYHLWLAQARNYLCVKAEALDQLGKQRVTQSSKVDELREIAPGIWLPSKVTGASYDYQALREGKQVADWTDTLVLEKATVNPNRAHSFFRDVNVPTDLPTYTIENGRLTGSHFEDREPPADAAQKLAEIVAAIRQNERHYDSLEIELDKTYHKFGSGITGQSDSFVENLASTTRQHSILDRGQAWYMEHQNNSLADGSVFGSEQVQAYDGSWARRLETQNQVRADKAISSAQASLQKGGLTSVPVLRPQMLLWHSEWKYQPLSDYLTNEWDDRVNRYRLKVTYLGDETRDGLLCAVLRMEVDTGRGFSDPTRTFRVVWLARDRNYLPVRYEWHEPACGAELPTGTKIAKDLRELRPGVWCPFRIEMIAFQKWDVTDLSIGRVIINHRTDYTVRKATLEPKVAPGQFAGPAVPKGTKVYVQNEAGRALGNYEQPELGPLSIADNIYLEMLNAANVEEGKRKERLAALDGLVGQPAPEIPKTDWINAPPRTWRDFAGKVVVVDFWAHWCGPCTPDLKRLSELHSLWQDSGKSNVVIVGIHAAGSKREQIDEAVKTHKLGYPICIDALPEGAEGWGTLFNLFAVHAIPETFVIDKDGKVAAHGRLEEMLAKANQLAEKQARADEPSQAVEQANAVEAKQAEPKQADALPEGVLIRGQVLDDETGRPIERFRVLAGVKSRAGRDDNGPLPAVWQPHLVGEFSAGSFDWPAKRSYDEMRLRIEADGYQPLATDWIRKDDKPRTITLRLKLDPGIIGRVLRPDGQPAPGATLAIALTNREVRLEGKSIARVDKPLPEKPSDRWRIPQFVKADADGRFRLPTETETCAMLCVVHEAGYLQLAVSQLSTAEFGPVAGPRELKLAAWGRIEGKLMWKDRPGVGEPIRLGVFRDFPGGAYPGAVSSYASAETDADGRFRIDNIPPGLVQISRLVKLSTGELSQYQLPITHVHVKSGAPNEVILGGQGVSVIGRLKGLGTYEGVTVRIAPDAPTFHGLPEEQELWKGFGALQASPVGPLYFRANIPVAKDGSFRIDEVLPAYYQLFLDSPDRSVIGGSKFQVDAEIKSPAAKPSADDKPQDIGEIPAKRKPLEKPKPGSVPVTKAGIKGGGETLSSQKQPLAHDVGSAPITAGNAEPDEPQRKRGSDVAVKFQVLDAVTDLPIENFGVRPVKVGEGIEDVTWTYVEGRGGEAKPDGRFETTIRWSDGWTACVFANGYLPQQVLSVPPSDGAQEVDAVVRLKPGANVRGKVLDHEGKPVVGAGVYGASAQGGLMLSGGRAVSRPGLGFLSEEKEIKRDTRVATDRDGQFRMVVGPAEKIAVSTTAIDAWATPLPEQGKHAVVRLPQPARLVVRYDIDGGPPKVHVVVNFQRTENPGLESVSVQRNAEVANGGEVVIEKLPPGAYSVGRFRRVQSDKAFFGSLLDRSIVSLEAGKTTSVDLTRPDGVRVSGQVRGMDVAGLKSVMVTVLPNSEPKPTYNAYRGFSKRLVRDVCLTDAKGRFTTERLLPGSYRFLIEEGDVPSGPLAYGQTSSEFFGETVVDVPKSGELKEVPAEIHLYRRVVAEDR